MSLFLHCRKVAMNEAEGAYFGLNAKVVCNLPIEFLVFFMKTEKKSRPEVGKKEYAQ